MSVGVLNCVCACYISLLDFFIQTMQLLMLKILKTT